MPYPCAAKNDVVWILVLVVVVAALLVEDRLLVVEATGQKQWMPAYR